MDYYMDLMDDNTISFETDTGIFFLMPGSYCTH